MRRNPTGVEALFDPFEEATLDRALALGESYEYNKFCLHRSLLRLAGVDPLLMIRPLDRVIRWGLASFVTGYSQSIRPVNVPWGWRRERCFSRDLYFIMPAWVYWIRRLGDVRWEILHKLASLGFLQAPEEGAEWSMHYWSWRVWESRYNRRGYRQRWFTWTKRCFEGMSVQRWS